MKRVTGELVYWLVVIVVYWWMTYDGPPIRTVVWYAIDRACKQVAYTVGYIGLIAERKYMESVERTATC
jgi:hypothetical protein